MRLSLFILFICSFFLLKGQNKDSIIYILPDKVEMKLYEQIESYNSVTNSKLEFYLESIERETFRIVFSRFQDKSNNYWVDNTNRFVLIKDRKYPLILDYDLKFSTMKPSEVGEYGQREGLILKSLFIYDGYNITFDLKGNILKEDLGIYKKE